MTDRFEASVRFAVVPEWVLDHPDLSDRAVRLYGVLARYADTMGHAWPARSTLGNRLYCSVDSVDRALKELAGVGAITKRRRVDEAGDPTSNLYVLHPAGNQQTFPMSADVRGGGRNGAPTPGRSGAGTGGRTGAAQNENHHDRESFEREPSLDGSAPVRQVEEVRRIVEADTPTLTEEELNRIPKPLRDKITGTDTPEWVTDKEKTP